MKSITPDYAVELIRSNMLFQSTTLEESLSDEAIYAAAAITTIKEASAGDCIFKAGSIGDAIFLALKGEVGVYITVGEGVESHIATVTETNFFGEIAMIDKGTTRTATVKAISACLLGIITRDDFWNFYKIYPQIGKNLLWAINKRLQDTNTQLVRQIIKERDMLVKFNKELERKVMEKTSQLRQKDIQLIKMDRIASTGILAAGIAHEINNPLSFISSSMSFLEKSLEKTLQAVTYWNDKPVEAALLDDYRNLLEQIHFSHIQSSLNKKFDMIKRGITRISTIVNSLRSISRVDQDIYGTININQSISEIITILSSQKGGQVRFVTHFTDLPGFECATSDIHQCLLHLLTNALDAVTNGGVIEIETLFGTVDDRIRIRITDNGIGMADEVLQKAFVPFFTTKPVGSGTGLGLSITQAIVKRHGGTISLNSKEGEGTSVILTFPLNPNK